MNECEDGREKEHEERLITKKGAGVEKAMMIFAR